MNLVYHLLLETGKKFNVRTYSIFWYDERQFCVHTALNLNGKRKRTEKNLAQEIMEKNSNYIVLWIKGSKKYTIQFAVRDMVSWNVMACILCHSFLCPVSSSKMTVVEFFWKSNPLTQQNIKFHVNKKFLRTRISWTRSWMKMHYRKKSRE